MRKLFHYLNPIARLGEKKYSLLFPLLANLFLCIASEVYAYGIAKNSMIVGAYIIFLNVAFIIYFSFRDGIMGGSISSFITVLYYFYIIYTRHYSGMLLSSGISPTIILAFLYFITAIIIGWLKQTIDSLIEQEADEQKQAEEAQSRLAAIVTSSADAIISKNLDGIIASWNKGAEKIFGYKEKEIIGKSVRIIIPPELQKEEDEMLTKLRQGKKIDPFQTKRIAKNGRKIDMSVTISPIKNSDGKIIGTSKIARDITKQKHLQQQKDEFLGIASHELKTPVTSIKSFAQVLRMRFTKEGNQKAAELLGKLDSQVDKLTSLIADLLDVTKIESGEMHFNNDFFFFDELVDEIVEELQRTTEKHRIIKKGKTEKTIFGDRERIGQVLTNLIANAIKYSPYSRQIIINSSVINGKVKLCVQDFGVGIAQKKQDKIFERFFRVSGPGKDTYPGLGLGLYISSEIIKRSSGKIWIESMEGKGSTFCFMLPLAANIDTLN